MTEQDGLDWLTSSLALYYYCCISWQWRMPNQFVSTGEYKIQLAIIHQKGDLILDLILISGWATKFKTIDNGAPWIFYNDGIIAVLDQ